MIGRAARAGSGLAVFLAIVALTGCQPRQRYQPLRADSTATPGVDSLQLKAEAAVKGWDGGNGVDAARLSAALLAEALRGMPADQWSGRARVLLDSLSIGSEVADAPGAMMVNFFSRSDPEHGSWPWLFWSTDRGPRRQAVEGRDLRLVEMTSRGGPTPDGMAALFTRRGATGGQPIVFTWKGGPGGSFSLAQTLGADSLGGAGTAEFVPADSSLELQTRTYRQPAGFIECATCPHVYTLNRFLWGPTGFVRLSSSQVPSPYSTFVRFIQALRANDRSAGLAETTNGSLWDRARDFEWNQPRGAWRVAPSTDETAREMVFFRGERDAFRVEFEPRFGDWKISGFDPASRSVE